MSDKKLFCVRVETDVYVVAADEDEATYLAGRAMREESRETFEIYPDEVKPGAKVRESVARSLPWGDNLGSRRSWTVGKWLASLSEGHADE